MSDHGGGGGGGVGSQRQCRRGVSGDVELDAAMALADMAGVEPAPPATAHPVQQSQQHQEVASEHDEEEEELASTRLSLELGKVGIQSSSCSSSSSAGLSAQRAQAHAVQAAAAAAAPGYGARPGRHALTEAEKEAKRLRRVLANRESARQTILRRQAIRDELARKVADLSSQNESMKKEKETVMQEYLTLKETNEQLKEQVVAKTTKKAPAASAATAMDAAPPPQRAEAMPSTASPPAMPPRPSFLYASAAAPAVPVPYVWGSWPGYEHGNPVVAAPAATAPLCAWYYPVATDPRGSPPPTSYTRPFQQAASGGGSGTAEEDTDDDDPCSLTLGLDVDRKVRAPSTESGSRSAVERPQGAVGGGDREKAEAAAEARKRRKELTKLKQTQPGGRSGDE